MTSEYIDIGTILAGKSRMKIQLKDRDKLRNHWCNAQPFPFVKIDHFLEPVVALQIADAFPDFENALEDGRAFDGVNERKKVQITDLTRFPRPIAELNAALASPDFLADLSYISGIPGLLADNNLVGGGMHLTGPGGRLDVHVDFNFMQERALYRRINLLLYLNPHWKPEWGGEIQLWDKEVQRCEQAFAPVLNRCVIFETSETSYHGVTPVAQEAPFSRHSFATYYYTEEAPPNWSGKVHSTVFRARPEERLRKYILMPAERLQRHLARGRRSIKQAIKSVVRPND
jgi:hypothetical protein